MRFLAAPSVKWDRLSYLRFIFPNNKKKKIGWGCGAFLSGEGSTGANDRYRGSTFWLLGFLAFLFSE